jgi:hypothetical protein
MYCPQCATQNIDGAQFCRSCGVNLGLVAQALTGQLQPPPNAPLTPVNEKGQPLSQANALRHLFMGFSFIAVSLILSTMPFARFWWFWMLIPALGMIGVGGGELLQIREFRNRQAALPPAMPPTPPQGSFPASYMPPSGLPARNTGEITPQPFSVTEATTRHLAVEPPRQTAPGPAHSEGKKSTE